MAKIIQYIQNVAIGLYHIPVALLGQWNYSPDDGYIKTIFVSLDCFGNALTGGDPGETISSRSAKAMIHEQGEVPPTWGWGCRLCSFLAAFQQNHCQKAIERNTGHRAIIKDES